MSKIFFAFLVTGTIIMVYVMISTGKTLETAATPLGIIDLEIAPDKASVQHILDVWQKTGKSPGNIEAAKKNTWLDFLFIIFYAPFLYVCCTKLAAGFKKTSIIARIGKLVAMGIIIEGILDFLENFGMLKSLNGEVSGNIALFTASCSLVKWTLVFIALLYILAALVAKLFIKKVYLP
jgi:hypothetical protein